MRAAILKSYLAFVLLLLAAVRPARAQPLIASVGSIECAIANADMVFVARLLKFDHAERIEGRDVHSATIAIEDTLKKDLFTVEPYRKLQIYLTHNRLVLADWVEHSSRLMVMYDHYSPYETQVIELVPDKMEVLKADFTLLRDPETVIRAAKAMLRRTPAGISRLHTFNLEVPRKVVAETSWHEFHSLMLSVPVDEQLEKRAIEYIRSPNYSRRDEGVRALRYFKSDENIARVRSLLDDPGWSYLHHPLENNGVEVRIYSVRREAFRNLKSWGIDTDKPVIREEIRRTSE